MHLRQVCTNGVALQEPATRSSSFSWANAPCRTLSMCAFMQPVRTPEPDASRRVVCVDLDGTLIASDMLWESFLELIKRNPLRALLALGALVKGKAHFKRIVAAHCHLDVAKLPFREEVLAELYAMRSQG